MQMHQLIYKRDYTKEICKIILLQNYMVHFFGVKQFTYC